MPGRHGKQRTKKKKSRREKKTEMEKMVADSYFGRQRKENSILKNLVPKRVTPMKKRLVVPQIALPQPDPVDVSKEAKKEVKPDAKKKLNLSKK